MNASDLLDRVLELEAPWRVLKVRNDLRARQVDIWIGTQVPKRSWIFGHKPAGDAVSEYVWRHANLGTTRCVVHAAVPGTASTANLPWCGDKDLPFTRLLALQIATMLSQGVTLQNICTLLDVSVADLWKFKHRLDSGRAGLSGEDAATAVAAPDHPADSASVPEADDPVWERLLDGSAHIDIRVLSLKLLLTKLREQMQAIKDKEVRVLKSYELQRYFARNEKKLGHELTQLRKH